jgi:hypothetical protein
MEMFLMALALSLLGVAVTSVLFAAATRDDHQNAPLPDQKIVVEPERFFGDQPPLVRPSPPIVPIEVLLYQLEHHVRLEQAAAESFVHWPTSDSLHSRTTSPLVH